MNIAVLGNGGREEAILWKLQEESQYRINEIEYTFTKIEVLDKEQVLKICIDEKIDMVIVGPEGPLADGIVDYFQKQNNSSYNRTEF